MEKKAQDIWEDVAFLKNVGFLKIEGRKKSFITPDHNLKHWARRTRKFGKISYQVIKKWASPFKNQDPIDQVSQSMRHASTQTTERYYCRAKAEPAFANVNEAYKTMFRDEPVMNTENV
jgi:hypothetical protein